MVSVPMMSGVIGAQDGEWRRSVPINLEPVVLDTKISDGQLRAAPGALFFSTGPGVDRGGVEWGTAHFRVMGSTLVEFNIQGEWVSRGDVGDGSYVAFDYSFDRLAIASSNRLWYWNGASLSQVTNENLGAVKDMLWIDGYFMCTDGTYIVVTELSDPMQVKPLKYGSAEEDPDPITGLVKIRGEVYVLGLYTIEVFSNVGGNGFPFQSVDGATIPFGCVAPSAKCRYLESFAFVGSARDEGLRVFIAGQGTATPISNRWVEDEIAAIADPTSIVLENRTSRSEQRLLVHLPTKTLCFYNQASQAGKEPVWTVLQSGDYSRCRLRHAVRTQGAVFVGDPIDNRIGILTEDSREHFGEPVQYQFDVGMIYGDGSPFILHSVELTGLPGRGPEGRVFMSFTRDGETYSVERSVSTGATGDRTRRIQWRPHTKVRHYLGLRFRSFDGSMPGFSACNIDVEQLSG